MGSQLNQDIRSALLNIERANDLNWDDIDFTTRQVLADIGTQRAHEANQSVMSFEAQPNTNQQALEVEEDETSFPSFADEDEDEDDDIALSQQNTPAKALKNRNGTSSYETPSKRGIAAKNQTPTKRSTPAKRSAMTDAETPFVCAFCGARYKHGRSRYRHHKAEHPDLPIPSSSEIPDQEYARGDGGEEDEEEI